MTEAALVTACMLGKRFGLVVAGERSVPMYEELISHYGLTDRIGGIAAVDGSVLAPEAQFQDLADDLAAQAAKLARNHYAEVVILAGALFTGMWRSVQRHLAVPVLDGIACAVRQAELLAHLNVPKPTMGSYGTPPKRELKNIDQAIVNLFDSGAASDKP
jgi:allantoin racemase